MLSINLDKIDAPVNSGHLIVVFLYDAKLDEFIIHDSSAVLAADGKAARVSASQLRHLSNRRGLVCPNTKIDS